MNFQLFVSGISMGFVYGMIAMGMVLIFRSVGVMNFAQGEFLMFGGYLCYTFNKLIGLNIVLSLILACRCETHRRRRLRSACWARRSPLRKARS